MKKFVALLLAVILCGFSAYAQQYYWKHMGPFPTPAPDTLYKYTEYHGLAVDAWEKVWVVDYYNRDSIHATVWTAGAPKDTVIKVTAVHVHNANGSEVSWSPIKFVTVGGVTDTIGGYTNASGRWATWGGASRGGGLRQSPDRSFVVMSIGNNLYKIDAQTGAGMAVARSIFSNATSNTQVSVGIDETGYVYTRLVYPGDPIKIFDSNLSLLGNVTDAVTGYCRAIDCSRDGMDVYVGNYTLGYIPLWSYSIPDAKYLMDTLWRGMAVESMGWQPVKNLFWVSSGSYFNPPNNWTAYPTKWDTAMWYGFSDLRAAPVDSFKWEFAVPRSGDERPRAIAFSGGGDTAYVAAFGSGGALHQPGVRWYVRTLVSVEPIANGVPETYALSQNYPNPFNPSTEIQFSIPKAGLTTIRVYTLLGQEVATLVNENLPAGSYKTHLNGASLASGTYIYRLTSGGMAITKKMLLVK
jgi:hypothetical protein